MLATLIFFTFSGVTTIYTYNAQLDTLIESSHTSLNRELPALAAELEQELVNNNLVNTQFAINTKMTSLNYQNIVAVDQSGLIIVAPQRELAGLHYQALDLPISPEVIANIKRTRSIAINYDSDKYLFDVYYPLSIKNRGEGIIYARYSIALDVQNLIDLSLSKSAIVALYLLSLLLFIALFVYFFIHKPINHLIDVGRHLQALQLNYRANIKGRGELKQLADCFNNVAYSLEEKIASQKAAEQFALSKHGLLESIFKALPDLFFVIDSQGKVIEFHSGNENALYTEQKKLVGCNITELLPDSASKHFQRAIFDTRASEQLMCMEYPLTVDNQSKFFEARLSPMPFTENIVIVVREITQRKRQEEMIFHHAFFDTLTNLPNRFLVMERLTQQIKEAIRSKTLIAVMFIDLDDFKKVNDSLGHEIGDKLLIASAKRLQNALRLEDTVARLGGDEFVILLSNLHTPLDAQPIAANLVRKFHTPLKVDKREFSISLSLGVALYPHDGDSPSELLRKADSAMYHSKQQGRNTFSFFTEQMSQDLSRRLLLEEHLRHALDLGEFEVYYQPQFDIKTNELIGAEALLRWHNSALGSVSPSEFIPLAESNGEIVEIGRFVLKTAIKQAKKWFQKLNKPFKIAVNLSPRQFKDCNLISDITRYIEQAEIPASLLELEITEGVLLSGDESVRNALKSLHQLGLVISMDDFGTGYSSLNYLRQYPFDILKIDQSFIADLSNNREASELVNSIITMSHSLGLRVIAEGIETLSQLKTLELYRCDVGQGFLLGKPMPSKDFENWIGLPHLE
ncbi:EAL domain-containing protein [Pseudoalteromonas sp. S16_S37]|uniref:EAL domain-containing protein n=1 Tax=Pseudoalteromonas sp. S16_S37 TaxID=2720228 RepID=UPI0016814434|nr:EAL domain-containing protein [Pseudoalteromonas sp. S16_S37]MBD1584272.1 EAL domain-containing protein [Pseudoalteromonas sp. S16_S37]